MSDTGTTMTPGQFVGGEDRTTPDGGAVVNGYYIPPGVDFAGLAALVPPDWEQAAKEIYGGYYAIIEKYPELKSLLLAAVSQKYSQEKFLYGIGGRSKSSFPKCSLIKTGIFLEMKTSPPWG